MAIYPSLYLGAGGGVLSAEQLAAQETDAAALVPRCELYNRLAAGLFEKFRCVRGRRPGPGEAAALALSAFAPDVKEYDGLLDGLMRRLLQSVPMELEPYAGNARALVGNDEEMAQFYAAQNERRLAVLTKNAENMTDERNDHSLIGLLRHHLRGVAGDLARGPVYAVHLLDPMESTGLRAVIRRQLQIIRERRSQGNLTDCEGACQQARERFHHPRNHSLFRADQKRFAEYRAAIEALLNQQFRSEALLQMQKVLSRFSEQMEQEAKDAWRPLAEVTENLLDTFEQNSALLRGANPIAEPMCEPEALQSAVDEALRRTDVCSAFWAFTLGLFDAATGALRSGENEIAKYVSDFCLQNVFRDL